MNKSWIYLYNDWVWLSDDVLRVLFNLVIGAIVFIVWSESYDLPSKLFSFENTIQWKGFECRNSHILCVYMAQTEANV